MIEFFYVLGVILDERSADPQLEATRGTRGMDYVIASSGGEHGTDAYETLQMINVSSVSSASSESCNYEMALSMSEYSIKECSPSQVAYNISASQFQFKIA